jgi:AcrR family transcriptional regulator
MPSRTRASIRSSRAENRTRVSHELLAGVERLLGAGERYSEISVDRLVQTSGISRSTFYYHFDGKSDLLESLIEEVISSVIDSADDWWNLPPGTTKAEFAAAMRKIFAAWRPHLLLWGAVVEAAGYDQGVRDRFDAMMMRGQGRIEEHINNGQQTGLIDPTVVAEEVAPWLTWMSERGFYQCVSRADDGEVEGLLNGSVEIHWRTLYERGSARAEPASARRARPVARKPSRSGSGANGRPT